MDYNINQENLQTSDLESTQIAGGDNALFPGQEFPKETEQNNNQKKPRSVGKIITIIVCISLAVFMLLVFSVVGVLVFSKIRSEKDQRIANEVITMIDKLDGIMITDEDADEINEAKEKYDSLNDRQKKLVTNSQILDDAIEDLNNYIPITDDEKAANEVIKLINTLNGKTITVDSESEIASIKVQYDALTDTQKALVTNYDILETAMAELQTAKDAKIADEVIAAIDSVDVDALGTDSTEIDKIFAQYNALTEEQKALVVNYGKLLEYQETIKTNKSKQGKVNEGVELANNFPGYTGKWGNFGAHINAYQGMIETVIRRDANLRTYFECNPDPNYLEMYVSRFTRDTDGFGIGSCTVTFTGYEKGTGIVSTMVGEVVIRNDGTLYFTMLYFY